MTQIEALDILKLGHNVFLTGAAGSGKTYLLNKYIEYLKMHKVGVGITASTGIAATHIGGTTIHSWSGMGIRDEISPQIIAELFKRFYLKIRFIHTKVLVIDEISMLHAHQLDIVDKICRAFKKIDYPFGGIQVILCGDFFQLPPVQKFDADSGLALRQAQDIARMTESVAADFVVQSEIWKEMNVRVCYLDEQYRQDDRNFLRVLNDIRNSEVNESTVEYLTERLNKDVEGYAKPTRLYTHNADVDKINAEQLAKLSGEEREFFMSSRGSLGLREVLQKSCLAPQKLVLKVGAQVMFVKNNYEVGYVNGTLGEVIDFVADTESARGAERNKDDLPVVRTFDGAELTVHHMSWDVKDPSTDSGPERELAAITQIPLRLAWAITIHKSQGMSLDAAEVDLSRSFIPGMGYVALSRVRNLTGLKLLGMNQMSLQVNPQVAEMDREFILQSHDAVLYLHSLKAEQKKKMQKDFLEYMKGK